MPCIARRAGTGTLPHLSFRQRPQTNGAPLLVFSDPQMKPGVEPSFGLGSEGLSADDAGSGEGGVMPRHVSQERFLRGKPGPATSTCITCYNLQMTIQIHEGMIEVIGILEFYYTVRLLDRLVSVLPCNASAYARPAPQRKAVLHRR